VEEEEAHNGEEEHLAQLPEGLVEVAAGTNAPSIEGEDGEKLEDEEEVKLAYRGGAWGVQMLNSEGPAPNADEQEKEDSRVQARQTQDRNTGSCGEVQEEEAGDRGQRGSPEAGLGALREVVANQHKEEEAQGTGTQGQAEEQNGQDTDEGGQSRHNEAAVAQSGCKSCCGDEAQGERDAGGEAPEAGGGFKFLRGNFNRGGRRGGDEAIGVDG